MPQNEEEEVEDFAAENRERALLLRHQLFFVVGLVLGMIGVARTRTSAVVAGVAFGTASACLLVSAASALAGGRHLFGSVRYGGFGSNVTTPSGRNPASAALVALVIALGALALAVQAGRLLFG